MKRTRLLLAGALVLAGAGIAVCGDLITSHLTTASGAVASALFCDGSGRFDCGQLATHPASVVLGRPLPVWGIVYFLLVLALATAAVIYRGLDRKAVVALGAIVCTIAVLYDVYLALVMVFEVKAICANCIVTYVINLLLALCFHALDRRIREPVRWSSLLPGWRAIGGRGTDHYRALVKTGFLATVMVVLVLTYALAYTPFARIEDRADTALRDLVIKIAASPPDLDMSIFSGQPAVGPENAPITAVVIGDFQCDFCRALASNLERIRRQRPDKIRTIFVNSPISSACNPRVRIPYHEHACWLAEAAECATEQGKFWEFHDLLFSTIPFRKVGPAAVEARLHEVCDISSFQACMASGRSRLAVEADLDLCAAHGLTATPTLVINGHVRPGAMYPQMLSRLLGYLISLYETDEGNPVAPDSADRTSADE